MILWIKFSCWETYSSNQMHVQSISSLPMKTPERRYGYCACLLSGNFEHIQYIYLALLQITLKVVSATFLLVCFLCLKESTCETRENVLYFFTSKINPNRKSILIKLHYYQWDLFNFFCNIFWQNNIIISLILIYKNCVIMARELAESLQ